MEIIVKEKRKCVIHVAVEQERKPKPSPKRAQRKPAKRNNDNVVAARDFILKQSLAMAPIVSCVTAATINVVPHTTITVMSIDTFVQTSLYFLALINPASKVLILSSIQPPYSKRELLKVSTRATFAALLILLSLSVIGYFLLKKIFQVEIYSLQVAGGIILFIIGLTAVRKGRFYEQDPQAPSMDISIVPLAAPLIAGPGTITAAISFSSTHGVSITILSLTTAIMINFVVMLSSLWIGKTLERFRVFGPLIRIAGLIVAAVAVQMVLTGISQWLTPVLSATK